MSHIAKSLLVSMIAVLLIGGIGYYAFIRPQPSKNPPLKEGPIIAFGDSLVKGFGANTGHDFVSILGDLVGQRIENRGVNGDTTASALARIDNVLADEPSVVIVLLGGNDFLRRVPQDQTFENLGIIVDRIEASGARVVLLGVRGGFITDTYAERFQSFADNRRLYFVPNVLEDVLGNRSLMSDEIHPNDAGYKLIAEKVAPALKEALK